MAPPFRVSSRLLMSLVMRPCRNELTSMPDTLTLARLVSFSATRLPLLAVVVDNSLEESKSGLKCRHRTKNILLKLKICKLGFNIFQHFPHLTKFINTNYILNVQLAKKLQK